MDVKVLIADDHPLFRAAMRSALTDITGPETLEAATVDDAMAMLAEHTDVELVFLDVNMPGNDGLTGLSEIRSQFSDVLVVIVSAHEEPVLIRKAMDLGASGYIPKSSSVETIEAAVNQVLDGEQWLPEGFDASISVYASEEEQLIAQRLSQLTPHQLKVLRMLSDGLLNKQIAYELAISESTVKQHVSAVLKKLGVINRTKAGVVFRNLMGTE
ncbi:response regulator transcription factor [Alteromonas sp. CYL-A6]|uniref:response regulator transcription factor n=1 Tax=Alteromonas nitratireducens TaxID=3390813 RepID=UPI0034C0D499